MITITVAGKVVEKCKMVIVVPQQALEESGYVQTISDAMESSSKHEFHTMSQVAYYQFQDDELSITSVKGDILIQSENIDEKLQTGLVLYRDMDGGFNCFIHEGLQAKKFLETAFRFCTRWIRLDI